MSHIKLESEHFDDWFLFVHPLAVDLCLLKEIVNIILVDHLLYQSSELLFFLLVDDNFLSLLITLTFHEDCFFFGLGLGL